MATGSAAMAKSNVSSDKHFFLAKMTVYSWTSLNALAVVSNSSISGCCPITFARPPSTAASKKLASATSLTLLLPPRLEFGYDLFFLESTFAELARDLGTQCGEQLAFEFNRDTCFWTWEKHASQSSPTSDETGSLERK